MDGIGIATIERITDGYPAFDGHRDFGAISKPREMQLKLFYQAPSLALADARRDIIYRIFRPFELPLKLRVTRDNGSVRQIDCHTIDVNDLAETERVGVAQTFIVKLLAPIPAWYDPTTITKTITPSVSPWADTLIYDGNRRELPIVKIYGQVTNFTMSVSTSFGAVTFEIPNIAAGAHWIFDCRAGYKTIKTNGGASQLNSVSANALGALYGFSLAPANFVSGGVHSFSGTYTAKDANHKIEIIYNNRYWGI